MDVDFGTILNPIIAQTLSRIASSGIKGMPNLLICGPPGCGKTRAVQLLVSKLYGPKKNELVTETKSASLTIKDVRTKVKTHSQRKTIDETNGEIIPNCIIIDKAEAITAEAQWALRRILEQFSATCRYIFITSEEKKLIPALQSRLTFLKFPKFSDSQLLLCLESECVKCKIACEPEFLKSLVKECEGNVRQSINILHHLSLVSKGKPLSHVMLENAIGSLKIDEKKAILALKTTDEALVLADKLESRKVNLKQLLIFLLEVTKESTTTKNSEVVIRFKIFISQCDVDIAKGTVPSLLLCRALLLEYLSLV